MLTWIEKEQFEYHLLTSPNKQEESKKRNKRKGSKSSDFELENGW